MSNYKLTKSDRKFIRGSNSFFSLNPEGLSDDDLNEMNNAPLNKKLKKKYLLKGSDKIKMNNYVIPVNDGAVTGYYYMNEEVVEISGMSPLIVFYHGGGWIYGNMEFYGTFVKHLAEATGSSILLIDYRLAPKNKFPVAVEDCYDAFIWATKGAKYWKVDPDRIYLGGDGAGANLAAVVSILSRDRKGPKIAGQILLYPIVDGRLRTQSMENHKDSPLLTQKMLSFYVSSYAREPKDILSPFFSPLLSQDLTRLPQALIVSAEYDPLSDDAKLYAKALENAEVKVKHLEVKGAFNGFMPFKHGKGRKRTEGAIFQFVNGRTIENIALLEKKALKKYRRANPLLKTNNEEATSNKDEEK